MTGEYKDINTVTENRFKIDGGVSLTWGDNSRIGIDADFDYLHYSKGDDDLNANKGKLRLSPYYSKTGSKLNLKIGVNMDVSFSDGTMFRIAPDVRFDYKFINGFSFYANATGGKNFNTLADFYTLNRYISPFSVRSTSYTPIDAQIGFRVGPFRCFENI